MQEARAAAEAAARERAAILQAGKLQGGAGSRSGGAAPRGARQGAAGGARGSDGTPAWRSYAKKKALGRQAEATLEMIFSRTQVSATQCIIEGLGTQASPVGMPARPQCC